MKHAFTFIRFFAAVMVAAAGALLASGCKSGTETGKPVVTVSIAPQQWLLQQIAGADIEVNTMLPPGTDPETYEPSIQAMRRLEGSREYAMVGTLPFEVSQRSRLASLYPLLRISEAAPGMHLIADEHHHHHDHDGDDHDDHHHDHHHDNASADPHVWITPANLRVMADSLLEVAVRVNPSRSAVYEAAHGRLVSRLDSLERAMTRALAPLRGRNVVIWHPTLTYAAHDFGFRQLSIQEGHKEPSPRRMAEAVDDVKRRGAVALVVEAQHSPAMTEALNADMNLPVVQVDLLQPDVISTLNKFTHELANAAAK